MPKFTFNILDHKAYLPDPQGTDLPDVVAARRQAVQSAREILVDGAARGDDRTGWTVVVMDEADRTVLTLPFREALASEADEAARSQEDHGHADR